MEITVTVNGSAHTSDVEPRLLLVHYLRDDLGLTGTNVGCDTSSCGACTVLRRRRVGEVVHGARRPGRRQRDHDHRGPGRRRRRCTRCRRPSRSTTACSAASARPGMVMAAVSLLKEQPAPDEAGRAGGPRGQPLPLHRLPQHRQGRPGRRRRGRRHDRRRRHPHAAQGGPRPAHRRGPLRRRPRHPGRPLAGHGAQPARPRPHHAASTPRPRWPCPACGPCSPAPTCATRGPRRCRAPGRSPTT